MKLTGTAVPFETLSTIKPNTVLVVIADNNGKVSVVEVDHASITTGESFLRVTANETQLKGGCWVWTGSGLIWMDPCPY